MDIKRYTISIVVLNNLDLTRKCLQLIEDNSGSDYELIISDNGSDDGTAEFLQDYSRHHAHCKIISYAYNTGFGHPHNNALREAGGEYFIILNNDIFIHESGWLEKISDCFRSNLNLAIAGFAGNHCALTEDGDGLKDPSRVEYVEGSCLMIPKQLACNHGLFAEEYELAYWEDVDLSLRYRQMGFDIQLVNCRHDHVQEATAVKINKRLFQKVRLRNHNLFKSKWSGYLAKRCFTGRVLIKAVSARIDHLLAVTTIIRQLKSQLSLVRFDLITNLPDVFKWHPDVSEIFPLSVRLNLDDYDRAIEFDFSAIPSDQPIVLSLAEQACVTINLIAPVLFLSAAEMDAASKLLPSGKEAAFVALTNSPEIMARTKEDILIEGYEPVTVEAPMNNSEYRIGQGEPITFREMAAVIASCRLFVGEPGVLLQVAQACGVRSLAILKPGQDPFVLGIDFVRTTCLNVQNHVVEFNNQNNRWNLDYLQSLVHQLKSDNNYLWQIYGVAKLYEMEQIEVVKKEKEHGKFIDDSKIEYDSSSEYEHKYFALTQSLTWRMTRHIRSLIDFTRNLFK